MSWPELELLLYPEDGLLAQLPPHDVRLGVPVSAAGEQHRVHPLLHLLYTGIVKWGQSHAGLQQQQKNCDIDSVSFRNPKASVQIILCLCWFTIIQSLKTNSARKQYFKIWKFNQQLNFTGWNRLKKIKIFLQLWKADIRWLILFFWRRRIKSAWAKIIWKSL